MYLPQLLHRLSVLRLNQELGCHCCLPCLMFSQSVLPFFANFCMIESISAKCTEACLKVECCLQASRKTILQRMLLCFTLLVFYQMVSFHPPPHYTEFLSLIKFDAILFLGPRGPLVLPSVGPSVRSSARKIWITYIQAYMPYES